MKSLGTLSERQFVAYDTVPKFEYRDVGSFDDDPLLMLKLEGFRLILRRSPIAALEFEVRRECILKCRSCDPGLFKLTGHEEVGNYYLSSV